MPGLFTAPWAMEIPQAEDAGCKMFEYACREGNSSMVNVLSGARAAERAAAGGGSR
jgi:hypothetical protein